MILEMCPAVVLLEIILTTLCNHRNTFAINNLMFIEHLKVGQWIFLSKEEIFANSSCQNEYFNEDEVFSFQLLVSRDKW